MKNVGFIGWRGMVGSVLMQRMLEENDFEHFTSFFFSTSSPGKPGPKVNGKSKPLGDAFDINALLKLDVIVTCQGSDHTNKVHPKLRAAGWQGYWIDAASSLRMKDESILVLDPVNRDVIDAGLAAGKKDLIGVNCTVSPMMMALTGLFKNDLVEWVSSMTYQAASGGGSRHMIELLEQMKSLGNASAESIQNPAKGILDIDAAASKHLRSGDMPIAQFGQPLAGSLLPWIDSELENGQSREEWKGQVETNKILGQTDEIKVDGTCVRISAMRSHSMALTIKLKKDLPINEIESLISGAHDWVHLIPNNKEATLKQLNPVSVNGSLKVHVGRVRKTNLGPEYLNAFVVGDQLLWGAAEPLRRALLIVTGNL